MGEDQRDHGSGGGTGDEGDAPPEISGLEEMLDRLGEKADEEDRVSLGAALEVVGHRSLGPLVLLAGVITLAPVVGDIPGVPTVVGLLVLLASAQLLVGRKHLWLPGWLLNRSVDVDKLSKALEWLRRPAGFVDRLTGPRLVRLVRGAGARVIAVACLLIALGMPPMEVVPFSANGAGAALTLFGLALIATDGLLALVGLGITTVTFGLVGYALLG